MADKDFDYYDLLGVDPKVSPGEIKSAFHSLAQKYHPDKGDVDPDHAELFKRITEAYRVLSDPARRNAYNKEKGYLFHEEINLGGLGEEQPFSPPPPKQQKKAAVEVGSTQKDWSHLRNINENDLKVEHKVALTPEDQMEELKQQEADVAAWGEEEDGTSGGMFSRLGGRRRGGLAAKRAELKKNLKQTISEENQPKAPPGGGFETEPQPQVLRPEPKQTFGADSIENPLKEERIFNFQITALEAALGTNRELVLHATNSERPNKLEFDIPAGITDGTVMEVSRGWDRAKVRISIVQDPLFLVEGNDVRLRIPVTLKEALDGEEIAVPGIDQVTKVKLRTGADSTTTVCLEGQGINNDGEVGDLYVTPFIIAPLQVTETLKAAVAVIDQHYDQAPKDRFISNPTDPEFFRNDSDKVSVFVPITMGEALRGLRFQVSLLGTQTTIAIPEPWDHTKELIAPEQPSGKLAYIYPGIPAPQRSSGDLQAAALAVEQHYLRKPRSHLPRILRKK